MVYTGFITGSFTMALGRHDFAAIDARWQPVIKSAEQRATGHRLYVPAYYDFCYSVSEDRNAGFKRYSMSIDSDVCISVGVLDDKSLAVHVGDVELCVAPFSMMLYSVRFDIDSDDIDAIIAVVNKLRYTSLYVADRSLDEFRRLAIMPIMKVFENSAFRCPQGFNAEDPNYCRAIVENGNKFKVFQIASVDESVWRGDNVDNILFELGFLSRIGVSNPNDMFAPSDDYFRRTMDAARIDIFSNWRGLALFDTFTMLGHSVQPSIREYWIECNFKMLYMSQLFVKMYLIRLNNSFRMYLGDNSFKLNRSVANKLQNRYDEFECKCWFDNVAYSILPCEIHSIIGQSMGISVEKERLYEKIMRQNQKREKLSDQRMNKLLLFMTVLAMSSAIWDACCLIEGMYSFDLHQSQLFIRIVTYVVLFVIFIIMFLNYRRQDR